MAQKVADEAGEPQAREPSVREAKDAAKGERSAKNAALPVPALAVTVDPALPTAKPPAQPVTVDPALPTPKLPALAVTVDPALPTAKPPAQAALAPSPAPPAPSSPANDSVLGPSDPAPSTPQAASAPHRLAPLEALSLRDLPIPHVPVSTARPWRSYKEILASLAQRVLDAQRPIRILQALRWDGDVEEQFFRGKQRELPKVGYSADLGFDPEAKIREIDVILRDADRELGKNDRLGDILRATADEYRKVVRMLEGRGTRAFYTYSRELYGSAKDVFPDGRTTVRDMGLVLYDLFTAVGGERLGRPQPRDISAETAALELNARFDRFFGGAPIRVQVDDALLADAAAGSDYVKIRSGAMFSKKDIDILEAHEGWVHVATSLNGQAQPVARWLAKGPPRTTAVQEGLAALVEIFTFRSTPRRAKKLNDRILAVDKAEDGASFLDVFEWYRTEGYDEAECFQNARRVFRGGLLEGGAPFTKDACYCKGIVLNYAFMRAAIQLDRAELIPFLFVGKVAHEDVPILHAHVTDGIVKPPPFLPAIFDEMSGLAIWMCYSSFFSRLGGTAIAEHYTKMLG